MTAQLTLDTDTTELPPLQPGDWTPTGWGAMHRVRRSDEKWTELTCHTVFAFDDPAVQRKAGESHRCSTSRIDRAADETNRCQRCAALPDLGPLRYGNSGEVRRSPDGLVVVCHRGGPTDMDVYAYDRGWKVIGRDPEASACYGWRSDWAVASWQVLGNVHDLAGPTTAAVAAPETTEETA